MYLLHPWFFVTTRTRIGPLIARQNDDIVEFARKRYIVTVNGIGIPLSVLLCPQWLIFV